MGEAKDRGNQAARLAAALEREERRRAEWADEMVADAAALLEAGARYAKGTVPAGTTDDVISGLALTFATLAAHRAVAADLVDALSDPADDDEPEPAPRKPAAAPLSLLTPKPSNVMPPEPAKPTTT